MGVYCFGLMRSRVGVAVCGWTSIFGVLGALSVGLAQTGTAREPIGAQRKGALRILLLGQALIRHELGFESPQSLEQASQFLAGADVAFTDLESPVQTREGMPFSHVGLVHKASPEVFKSLKAMHVNLLALSNNHAWDLGAPGILGTIEEAQRSGFTVAGTGRTLAAAAAPAYLDTENGRVALVAAACGGLQEGAIAAADRPGVNALRVGGSGEVNPNDSARILDAVREAKSRAKYVVLYLHNHCFDTAHPFTPPAWLTGWAHLTIDAGASVFVTHGVPGLQGVEVYLKHPVFYGLGNFVFQVPRVGYYTSDPYAWKSVVADLRLDEDGIQLLRFTPIVLHETAAAAGTVFFPAGAPRLATEAEGSVILARLAELSQPFQTVLKTTGNAAELSKSTSK
jgi:poly-gamma-glutamate capsule biosynthesis protein CapA/YwtB (metallophosphatase superfamily)